MASNLCYIMAFLRYDVANVRKNFGLLVKIWLKQYEAALWATSRLSSR